MRQGVVLDVARLVTQRLELGAGSRVVLLRQGGAFAVDGPKSVDPAAFVTTAAPDAVTSLLGRKTTLAVAGASRSVGPPAGAGAGSGALSPPDVDALLRAVNADSLPTGERTAAVASAYLLAGMVTEALAVAEAGGDPALVAAIRGAAGLDAATWPLP